MIDVTANEGADDRRIINNMLECIVRLGMQDDCTLDEFKDLLVGAVLASRRAAAGGHEQVSASRSLQSA